MFKKKTAGLPAIKLEPGMSKGEWMQKYWRPCAAFMYMICCLCDFAVFPIMFTVVQFWENEAANDAFRQWVPITLQGGGLFHVSMCAVLGVSAYGRTQEKLAGQSATPAGLPSPTLTSTPTGGSNGFSAAAAPSVSTPTNNFGSSSSFATNASGSNGFAGNSGFGSPEIASAEVVTGFGGKPAPVIPPFPER